jgi:hypothetical protein
MKKNAGISTIMVTGMAAFVSIFAMVLLIVLRGTIGGGPKATKAIDDAETRAKTVSERFVLDVTNADVDVYYDRVNSALICISKDQFVFTWLNNKTQSIYRTAMNYSAEATTDEKKVEEAKEKVRDFFKELKEGEVDPYAAVRGSAQTLSTNFRGFYVVEQENEAVLTLRVNYTDADGKKKVLPDKVITQAYSEGAKTYRAAHSQVQE